MNERVTHQQITCRLEENGLPCAVLELQHGVCIVVSERGGRIIEPFLEPRGRSLFWVNPAFRKAHTFRSLLAKDWNLGGQGWWVSPETQYLCRDRNDYSNGEYVQPAMDPGDRQLRQDMTLEVFNLG